jgi:hypothetical protein
MSKTHTIPELDRSGLRGFGLTTGAIVGVVFGLVFPWLLARNWPLWPWVLAAPLWALAFIAPMWLRPIYRGWMRFGMLASRVTTPLILGTVFFIMIVPASLFRRLKGTDAMRLSFDADTVSYRIASQKTPPERLERPF